MNKRGGEGETSSGKGKEERTSFYVRNFQSHSETMPVFAGKRGGLRRGEKKIVAKQKLGCERPTSVPEGMRMGA